MIISNPVGVAACLQARRKAKLPRDMDLDDNSQTVGGFPEETTGTCPSLVIETLFDSLLLLDSK